MEEAINIKPFLDEAGRITKLPRRQKPRYAIMEYLAEKFEPNTVYNEHQANDVINRWHTFDDHYLLRRELVDSGLIAREKDGSKYWRQKTDSAQ